MNSKTLTDVFGLLSSGVITIGAVMAIVGIVQLGMNIKDGATGGGQQMAGAIAMIVGGGIIIAAGVLFKGIDTSWVG